MQGMSGASASVEALAVALTVRVRHTPDSIQSLCLFPLLLAGLISGPSGVEDGYFYCEVESKVYYHVVVDMILPFFL